MVFRVFLERFFGFYDRNILFSDLGVRGDCDWICGIVKRVFYSMENVLRVQFILYF